ncbi:unnamed protein product [Coccothraustes coccothraustes]
MLCGQRRLSCGRTRTRFAFPLSLPFQPSKSILRVVRRSVCPAGNSVSEPGPATLRLPSRENVALRVNFGVGLNLGRFREALPAFSIRILSGSYIAEVQRF